MEPLAPSATGTRLIYITGLSHSGSTLLDLLLNAHSRCVSVGELRKFSTRLHDGDLYPCTCGEKPLGACSFWPQVVQRLAAAGMPLDEVSTDCGTPAALRSNEALLEAISEQSGGAIVVDSSKVHRRLRQLLSAPSLRVLPLLLVRDPRGQICSTLLKGEATLPHAIRSYIRTHRKILKVLRDRPFLTIRYEALATDPRAALEPVLAHFGERFETAQLDWAAAEKHSLAGNRMRHGSSSAIRLDERWRSQLPLWQRLLIQLRTWPIRLRIEAAAAKGQRLADALSARTLANSDPERQAGHSRLFASRAPIA